SGLIPDGFSPLPGVQILLDFMLRFKKGEDIELGDSVLILEGGKASLEAASACKEKGVRNVYVLFRDSAPADLQEEGIEIFSHTVLTKMSGKGNKLEQVEICEVTEDGKEKEGSRRQINVDTILIGAGRFPELIYVLKQGSSEIEWETVSPYAGPNAEQEIGIFRPGEVVADYKAAVEAIGSGRRIVASLHNFLRGLPVKAPENMIRKQTYVLNVEELRGVTPMPRKRVLKRREEELLEDSDLEFELGYTEEEAREEAKRCLQCGLICYRKD
ncbi:MAG: hypothetical protein DRG27_04445, partial [Deltaproteobacteria bacterium]